MTPLSEQSNDSNTSFKEELEKIMYEVFMAGLGIAGADDIDPEEHDKAILNTQKHYTKQALTSIINLVDKEVTEYQKLFIDAVEIGLKGVGLSLNEKEWLDLIAVFRESQKTAQRAIIRGNDE